MFDNLLIETFDLKTLDNVLLSVVSSVGVDNIQYQPGSKCNLLYKVSDFVVAGCVVVTGVVGASCETERMYFSEDKVVQGSKLFSSVVGLTFEELSCKIGIDAVTKTGQPILKEKLVGKVKGRLSSSARAERERVIIPGAIDISTHTIFMSLTDGGSVSLGSKLVKDSIGYLVVSKILRSDSMGEHHYEFLVKKEV